MALTQELITANEALSGLSAEQVSAITQLSTNNEQVVLSAASQKFGVDFAKRISESTGIAIAENQASDAYIAQALNAVKSGLATAKTSQQKIAELTEQIKSGKGSEAIVAELEEARASLAKVSGTYTEEKNRWEAEKTKQSQDFHNFKVTSALDSVFSKLAFKEQYPVSVQNILKNDAKAGLMSSYKTEWVDQNGQQVLSFLDAKGDVLRNPVTLKPLTAEDLLKDVLKDSLAAPGAPKTGTGSNPPAGPGANGSVDLSGVGTQLEANKRICDYLMKQGETRGSSAFQEKQTALLKLHNVMQLPIM